MNKLVLSRSVLAACAAVFVLAVVLVGCQGSDTPTAPETTAPQIAPSSLLTSGSATPDGDTPSEEAVCDDLTGPAFGLCNSYCEAMDCDCDGVSCTPNASQTACDQVKARFVAATGDTPPCGGTPPPSGLCGNGICEAGNGEDCLSCAADCNGEQGGKPSNRFCCGDGDGLNPVPCSDSRCVTGAYMCTNIPVPGVSLFQASDGHLIRPTRPS